jgi:hypothetical protein
VRCLLRFFRRGSRFGFGFLLLLIPGSGALQRLGLFTRLGAGQAYLAHGQLSFPLVALPEPRQLAVDLAHGLPLLVNIPFLFQQPHGRLRQFHHEDFGETFAQSAVHPCLGGFFVEIVGSLQQQEGGFAGFLAAEPIEMAGLFPVGQVLVGNGAAAELFLGQVADLREAMEPLEDFVAVLVIFDAAVEFVADGFGQAADFTNAANYHMRES